MPDFSEMQIGPEQSIAMIHETMAVRLGESILESTPQIFFQVQGKHLKDITWDARRLVESSVIKFRDGVCSYYLESTVGFTTADGLSITCTGKLPASFKLRAEGEGKLGITRTFDLNDFELNCNHELAEVLIQEV